MQKVSIVIPTRNEEKHISKVLDSLVLQDYPKDQIEILVIDGRSTDGTRRIVERYRNQFGYIEMLDNPWSYTPMAFNIGIQNAAGEVIFFMGAHTTYSPNYISVVVQYLSKGAAECVGSVAHTLPGNDTRIAKAIAWALSSPFGVGNSHMRIGTRNIRYVDTASCMGYRKEVFEKIGLFNERLIHSQDIEFNHRLRKAGMRILLVPTIVSYYQARPTFASFCRHNFRNGIWAILPLKYSTILPISLRHFVPMIFIGSLLGTLLLSFWAPLFFWFFLLIGGSYLLTNFYFSMKIAVNEKNWRMLFFLLLAFGSLHLVNGAGSLWGALKLILPKKKA